MKDRMSEKKAEFNLSFLKSLPLNYFYHFVMHARTHDWTEREEEKTHSLHDAVNALVYGLKQIQQGGAITFGVVKEIHKRAGATQKKIDIGECYDTTKACISFGFPLLDLSVEGFSELTGFAHRYAKFGVETYIETSLTRSSLLQKDLISVYPKTYLMLAAQNYKMMEKKPEVGAPPYFYYIVGHTAAATEKAANFIFDTYQKAIKKAKEEKLPQNILKAIIQCEYDLIHLHPFEDLNSRTSIILLNILLLENKFPPVLNFCLGSSLQEKFDSVCQGMLETLDLFSEDTIVAKFGDLQSIYDKSMQPMAEWLKALSDGGPTKSTIQAFKEQLAQWSMGKGPNWVVSNVKGKGNVAGPALKNSDFMATSSPFAMSSKTVVTSSIVQEDTVLSEDELTQEEISLEDELISTLDTLDFKSDTQTKESLQQIDKLIQSGADPFKVAPLYETTPMVFLKTMKQNYPKEEKMFQIIFKHLFPLNFKSIGQSHILFTKKKVSKGETELSGVHGLFHS